MSPTLLAITGGTVAVLFAALAVFQLLLALGLPLGRLAWGGVHERLPGALRFASLISVGIFAFGMLAVLERAGLYVSLRDERIVTITCWLLTVLFLFSIVGNLNSRSAMEKRVMTPVAVLLTAGCLILALGSTP